jgi:hypothetical protein
MQISGRTVEAEEKQITVWHRPSRTWKTWLRACATACLSRESTKPCSADVLSAVRSSSQSHALALAWMRAGTGFCQIRLALRLMPPSATESKPWPICQAKAPQRLCWHMPANMPGFNDTTRSAASADFWQIGNFSGNTEPPNCRGPCAATNTQDPAFVAVPRRSLRPPGPRLCAATLLASS